MRLPPNGFARLGAPLALAALCLLASQLKVSAQSGDIGYPAPVFSNEIAARITPRDLGDARRTSHFYIFKGTEGDVLVTVESSDLNGDVDVFAGRTLRPLLKVTLYGGTATKATKSFYLRKEETLILRVEARAVGDTDGSYRIVLGGSFAPAPPDLAARVEEPATPSPETSPRQGTRRVTSTGARIYEPPAEVAEATPTPTPVETSEEAAKAEEKPAARREPPRSRRGRGARGSPSRPSRPAPGATPSEAKGGADETAGKGTDETPKPGEDKPEGETAPAADPKPPRTSRRGSARAPKKRAPAAESKEAAGSTTTTPTEPPPAVTIQRLVIVTKDGNTLERDMSTVRRVTIENNQIVVVTKDGKTVRTPLALVEKMSFEP